MPRNSADDPGNQTELVRVIGPFWLDTEQSLLYNDDEALTLRPKPCRVLAALLKHPRGLSLNGLRTLAWSVNTFVSDKTIRQTVGELRKAFVPMYRDLILNRSGRGYVLNPKLIKQEASAARDNVDSQDPSGQAFRFYDEKLPPPQLLFGREAELTKLENVYRNRKTRVAVIRAPLGGEGKTQLAQNWLRRKFATSQSAIQIFAFSFNGQGSGKTEGASSDLFLATALDWLKVRVNSDILPDARAELLAQAILRTGTTLYLDGVEPLQKELSGTNSILRDGAIRKLLLLLARPGNHFCLISTQREIGDLAGNPCVVEIGLRRLDPESAVKVAQCPFYDMGVQALGNG